ncbi:MAG: diguanylate cyclase [Burkholderiales bacterium]|nr:diguanylate cyclase [Burkholderiales bacterium]
MRFGAIVLAYVVVGRIGLSFPVVSPQITAFWPPAGLALAVLFRWGGACALPVFAGAMGVAMSAGAPWWLAAGIALGNTVGPWVSAKWLERAGFHRRLEQRRDLWLLIVAGAFGGALLSAANGASWLMAAGVVSPIDLPRAWFHWWVGDCLGVFVAGVPLLTFSRRAMRKAFSSEHRLDTIALLGVSLAAVALSFWLRPTLGMPVLGLMLVPPVLLSWLAMRSGLAVASGGVLLLTAGMLIALASGVGPLMRTESGLNHALLWAYILALDALVLMPHVLLGEIARLEERWHLALVGSDLGVADWNLRTGDGFSSPRWRALMDDPSDAPAVSLSRWLARVHPDDRSALDSALAPLILSGQTNPSAGVRHEARLRVRDGWCWFDVHVTVVERDKLGIPQRVVASLSDIGARRSAEDRQQLSSNLFLNLHEGLLVADADMRVIDANPTYLRIMGIPHEQLIGTVPSLLRPNAPELTGRPHHASLWATLRTSGSWVGEVVERRRNGEPCALHVTVSSVHGPDGALRYYVLVVSDITEQRMQRERLERQAHFDELTRLPNRARLSELLAQAMATTDREGYLLAVCYLDIDRFKVINERFGHEAGDRMLAELANRLRGALRARGAAWSDAAARLGGDEFALLLRASTVEEARAAVERVLRVVSEPMALMPNAEPVVVTASVGATVYPLDSSDADTLLRHADHAMYSAKQSGRNGFLFFDPETSRRTEERIMAIGRVQDALDRRELALYYQPKVDLKRGVVLGFEALLRWIHP